MNLFIFANYNCIAADFVMDVATTARRRHSLLAGLHDSGLRQRRDSDGSELGR